MHAESCTSFCNGHTEASFFIFNLTIISKSTMITTPKRAEKTTNRKSSALRKRKSRQKAAEERRRAEVADRQKSSRQNKRKKDLDGVDARERKRKSRKMKSNGLPPNDEEESPQNDAEQLAESHLNSASCLGGSNGVDELLESLNKISLLPENFSEQLPEEVRAAAKKHFLGMSATDDSGEVHKAPVCVVCDRFIIKHDDVKWVEKSLLLQHESRLGKSEYEDYFGIVLPDSLKEQYTVDDEDLSHLLLSPRAMGRDGSYMCCDSCKTSVRPHMVDKRPPRNAIANGFAIGSVPREVLLKLGSRLSDPDSTCFR